MPVRPATCCPFSGLRVPQFEQPALSALSIAISALCLSGAAQGQPCPTPGPVAVVSTGCIVAPSTTINVTTAATPGLSATGVGGLIQASGLSLILGAAPAPPTPRNFVGARASAGGSITLNGGGITTLTAGTGQRGLVATGSGSVIRADSAGITVGIATTANDVVGAMSLAGGLISLTGTSVATEGTGNGSSNHGLIASDSGSAITMDGGSVSTRGRGSFGVLAQNQAQVTLNNGASVGTLGAPITLGTVGSHALFAASGGQIAGNNITLSASGNFANGARADGAGSSISLDGSTITTSGAGNKLLINPQNAGAMAIGGGSIQIVGSTIQTTGLLTNFNHGVMAQGTGAMVSVNNSSVTTLGLNAVGLRPVNGGSIDALNTSILTRNAGGNGAWAEGPDARLSVRGGSITVEGRTAYGVRANSAAGVTLDDLSVTTMGLDGSALFIGGTPVTVRNVTILSTGNDNAMGVMADGGSNVSITGGSVTTTGSMVRAGARPHGVAARNPGAQLTVDGTPVRTTGNEGMGVVADDGGTVTLGGNGVKTEGSGSIGIFSVVEQAGGQFAAAVQARQVSVETLGPLAHGTYAARNYLDAPSTISLDASSITTRGLDAVGIRARTGGAVAVTGSTVATEGAGAHGVLASDSRNGRTSAVSLAQSSITTTGLTAHGVVAMNGAMVIGSNATVQASGVGSTALYALTDVTTHEPNPAAPVVNFTGGSLTNVHGPTIGVAGPASITLAGTTVSGSGQWLHVGTVEDFPALASRDDPIGGIPVVPEADADIPSEPIAEPPEQAKPSGAALQAGKPGLAGITASGATLNGSASTSAGSVSSVVLTNGTTWNLTGSSNLTNLTNNASLIAFSPPSAGSFKTLTAVNYIGQGGTIGLNTVLGTDGSPSDRLIIDGGTASGASRLRITNARGSGAVTQHNGIQVVDAINGGTTQVGTFALANRVVAGPYEYQLYRAAADGSNEQAWYLRSQQLAPAPEPPPPPPPNPPEPPPAPSPAPTPAPLYRPEVGAYLANQRQAGGMFLHSLHDRLGEPQWIETQKFEKADDKRRSGWLRVVGRTTDSTSRDGTFDLDTDTVLIHGGGDIARWSVLKDKDELPPDRLHLGLMLGYGKADTDATARGNPARASGEAEGWSVGAYGTWYQNDESKLGWYTDLWGTYGWFKNSVRGDTLPEVKYDANALTLSAETGYATRVRDDSDWIVEPQAQIVYVKYSEDDITEPNGTRVHGGEGSGWIGRLGLRTHRTWVSDSGRRTQPYLTVNWWHDQTDNALAFNGVELKDMYPRNRYEVKLGVNADLEKGWTGWANVGYLWGSQSYKSISARLGAKYTW